MWIKKRHRIVVSIIKPFFWLYAKLRYSCKFDKARSFKAGALVLCNHVTTMDPFFMGMLTKENIYYMASKDLLEHRITGRLIEYLVHIIPKEKSKSNDLKSIKDCMRVAREGGIIGLFPEGNRTFSGELGYVAPSIVKLLKALKKPLAIINIKGGYPTDPRWGKSIRRGKMEISYRRVMEYEEYKDIPNDELYKIIMDNLRVDDYNYYPAYRGRRLAEHLERILYVCPCCHKMNTIYTNKNKIYCSECKLEVEYLPDLTFKANRPDFKFNRVSDWYSYQLAYIKALPAFKANEIIYEDEVGVYMPILYKSKKRLGEGTMYLYNDKFLLKLDTGTIVLEFDSILGVTLLGKKKMNIYVGDDTYQVFNDEKTNLLKYMNMYYLIKNRRAGEEDGFWGI